MRARLTIAFGFLLLGGCGFAPKPQNGLLPCDEGCPDGYVCRTDNRCWLPGTPAADSAIGQPPVSYDGAALEAAVDVGARGEVGKDVAMDGIAIFDGTIERDHADTGTNRDVIVPAVDAPEGAGGGGGMDSGAGGAAGMDGAAGGAGGSAGSGSGTVTGSGGALATGGTVVLGTGGMIATGGTVVVGTGGVVETGGTITSSGGVLATGGTVTGSGGVVSTGGTVATGGTITGSGGAGGAAVCVPSTDKQCAGTTHLKTCGTDGQWPSTGTPCPFVCVDNAGNTDACGGVCSPGTDKQCAGTTHLKTCGTDGQWPGTGTACQFVCVDNAGNTDACGGECVPNIDVRCADATHLATCGTNGQWPATGTPCPGTDVCRTNACVTATHYAGNRSALGTDFAVSTNTLYLFRMPAVARAAVVTALGAWGKVSDGTNVRLVVYADNGAATGANPTGPRITETNGFISLYNGAEEKDVVPTGQQLAAGQIYWIGIEFSQATTFRTASNGDQRGVRYSHTYGSAFSTLSTSGTGQSGADWAVFIKLQDLE